MTTLHSSLHIQTVMAFFWVLITTIPYQDLHLPINPYLASLTLAVIATVLVVGVRRWLHRRLRIPLLTEADDRAIRQTARTIIIVLIVLLFLSDFPLFRPIAAVAFWSVFIEASRASEGLLPPFALVSIAVSLYFDYHIVKELLLIIYTVRQRQLGGSH